MIKYKNTLLKLTDCTFKECKNIDEITNKIEPCKHCYLTKNPDIYTNPKRYPLVFFQKKRKISLMVISRDPNTFYKNLDTPRKNTTPDFIKWLINKIADNEDEYNKVIKAKSLLCYWAHITKCYSANNKTIAIRGSGVCLNILKWEIDFLKPRYIIGLGNDVGKALKELGKVSEYTLGSMLLQIKNQSELDGVLILPHPSGDNRIWKYNLEEASVKNTETNKKHSIKNLFYKLGSKNPRIKKGAI